MVQPIRDNVLVKPFDSDEVSEGGIFVPLSCRAVSNKVKVIAVGNGTKGKPMLVKEGQIAYRVKDWGQEIEIDGQLHYIMNQEAIIATN